MTDVSIFSNGVALEGLNTTLTFTIELSEPASDPLQANRTYYYSTFSNTATAGLDFTATNNTSIVFAVGERVKTISIIIANDNFVEADETFFVNVFDTNNIATQILIATNFGTITDVLTADVPTTLSANVDSLTLTGIANINGTGNVNANNIIGNNGNNTLDGGSGNDTLNGGAGDDSIIGGAGDDSIIGGTGVDSLSGGGGNDIYVIDASDKIIGETDGGGVDTIEVSTNYDLSVLGISSNIENLTLTGTAISGNGNGYGNLIQGNSVNNLLDGKEESDTLQGWAGADTLIGGFGDDLLDGGSGIDSLVGGVGNDTYSIDSASDKIVEVANEGIDTVQVAYGSYSIASQANLENISLIGLLPINAIGNTGNNYLTGNNRNNVLDGGTGNDTLDGNGGIDTLKGGAGNDTYILDNSEDTVDLVLETATGGTDTVITNSDYVLAANLENLQLLGNGDFSGTGNALVNTIIGNDGNNLLDGQGGNDILTGGIGNDTYFVDNSGDVVQENSAVNQGFDTAVINYNTSTPYELTDSGDKRFVENITLDGLASRAKGNSLANILLGNDGADTLDGVAGNDTLNGGEGQDVLIGGTGNDLYRINLGDNDLVIENSSSVTEIDTIEASYIGTIAPAYTLSTNIENFVFLGTANLNVTGNSSNNIITTTIGNDILNGGDGNDSLNAGDANDSLVGGAGNDTLLGGKGKDTLIGGAGNDFYVTDTASETLTEAANEGIDTIESTVSYTLKVNFENLTLLGTTNINGTGNSVNNIITGNTGNNTLDGQDGDDSLLGGGGNDILLGQIGNDTLDGGVGVDTFYGNEGNDVYVVDNIGDVVIEGISQGTDLVNTSISYTLTDNVENLTLLGTTAINGTGNALDNTITGNSGANIIDGTLGNDTMIGGLGNDSYYINSLTDVVIEAATLNGGIDTAFISINNDTLDGNVENLTLISSALKGTGNSLNNLLIGNSLPNNLIGLDGNDFLDGLGGNDTLVGGNGNDTYIINNTGVIITEVTGQGIGFTDLVISSITYTLGANVENLQLRGVANINGTGNSLDNNIAGNFGNNLLSGSIGNDTLIGNEGNDTLTGDQGNDILTGGLGVDLFNYKTNRSYNAADIGSDTILDFNSSQGDKLILGKTTFGLASIVGNSFSVPSEFASVTLESFVDVSTAKIVHSQQTGNLYFNANGTTPLGTSLIVDTNIISALSNSDFIIA